MRDKTPGDPIGDRRERNFRPPNLPVNVERLEDLRRYLSRTFRKTYYGKFDAKRAQAITAAGNLLLKCLQAMQDNDLEQRIADLEELITKLNERHDKLVTGKK